MSNAQNDRETRKRSGGFNFGWIIFMLVVFGQPLFRWLEPRIRALFAPSGTSATPSLDWLPWIVGGAVLLFVLVAVVRAASSAGQPQGPMLPPQQNPLPSSRPSLPQSRPIPPSSPSLPSGLPTAPLPPRSPQELGGPPRFEPIIEPNVLVWAIIVMVGVGLLALLFAPALLGL